MRIFSVIGGLTLAVMTSLPLLAQSTGLQVSLIPDGTRAIMADNKGRTAIWSYLGKQGELWLAEVHSGNGQLLRREQYNAQGYLVAVTHANGATDRFSPYRCTDKVGHCTYTITDAKGRKKKFVSMVKSTGTTYSVALNGEPHGSFKLGIYNIRTMQRRGNEWTKLKRIEN